MSTTPVTRLDPSECQASGMTLVETPETVIAIHLLRRGLCTAHAEGGRDRPAAVVLRSHHLPEELMGFGSDPQAIGRVLRDLQGWTRVNVAADVATRLGPIIAGWWPRHSLSSSSDRIGPEGNR